MNIDGVKTNSSVFSVAHLGVDLTVFLILLIFLTALNRFFHACVFVVPSVLLFF